MLCLKNSHLGCRLDCVSPFEYTAHRCSCESQLRLTLWQRGEGAAMERRCVCLRCAAGWDAGPTPRAPLHPWPWRPGSTARCRWGFGDAARSAPSTLRWPGPGRPAALLTGSWSPSWSAIPHPESIPLLVPGYTLKKGCLGFNTGKCDIKHLKVTSFNQMYSLLMMSKTTKGFNVKNKSWYPLFQVAFISLCGSD